PPKFIRRDQQLFYRHGSEPQVINDFFKYALCTKVFLREGPRCATVAFIVGIDVSESGNDVLHRVECKQSLASGDNRIERGVLDNHRLAGRQITSANRTSVAVSARSLASESP